LTYEKPKINWIELMSKKKTTQTSIDGNVEVRRSEDKIVNPDHRLEITDEEWTNASRLFRTASTGACGWPPDTFPIDMS